MRIRSIKPEFWTSETLAGLDRMARLTFIGLWSYVDDNGVGVDNDRLITAALYPLEPDPAAALESTSRDLAALAAAGVIVRYQTGGKRLVFVTNWDEHQRVSHPSKLRYPRPNSGQPPTDPPSSDSADEPSGEAHSGEAHEGGRKVSSVSREQGTGREEQGAEEKPSASSPRPTPGSALSSRVDAEEADTPPAGVDSARPDVEVLCARLHERITAGGSRATITTGWRRTARLMLDRDGRDLGEALRLVDWCQADSFWSANVLSMPTFRKQYDRLRLRAQQDPRWRLSRPVEEIPDAEIDPDAILGRDVASPPAPPREIEEGRPDARREWFERWRLQRHTERIADARRVLAHRAKQHQAAG